jgi:hypothetical protein
LLLHGDAHVSVTGEQRPSLGLVQQQKVSVALRDLRLQVLLDQQLQQLHHLQAVEALKQLVTMGLHSVQFHEE